MANKIKNLNSTKGDLTGYDCPECLNRGHFYTLVDGIYEKIVDCKCMEVRREIRRIENSGLKHLIELYTFDNYKTDEPWQKYIKDTAYKFLDDARKWFFIGGQIGAGKTHICTSIVGELLRRGTPAKYIIWPETVISLNGCVNDEDEYQEIIYPIKNAKVLYIDDFFKTETYFDRGEQRIKPPSGAEVKRAFEIINYRYNNDLTTVISSERTLEEILEIDQAVGSRIKQIARDYAINISRDKNKNYRLR